LVQFTSTDGQANGVVSVLRDKRQWTSTAVESEELGIRDITS
jgi:hypothetical protein